MRHYENPECPFCDAAFSVERIKDQWVCSCCGKHWPVETDEGDEDDDRE